MTKLAEFKDRLGEKLARNWRPGVVSLPCRHAVVSFTFDDFPRSAADAGAGILAERGLRGTFFAAGRLAGTREDGIDYFTEGDLVRLAEDQHEIGCHTFSHLRLSRSARFDIVNNLVRNQSFVGAVLGDYRLTSFAYPFGAVNPRVKASIGRRYPIARGISTGFNAGLCDVELLKAVPLERRSLDLGAAERILDKAAARGGWVIFFSHDVTADPSPYGTTPAELVRVVDAVQARGLEILPMKHALARVRFGG